MIWGIALIVIAVVTLLWQLYWAPRALRLNRGSSRTGQAVFVLGTATWASAVIYQGAEEINTSLLHHATIHEIADITVTCGILLVSIGIFLIMLAGKRARQMEAASHQTIGDTPHADT
ncbi:MAG: hypothetical protein OJF49_003100 [Ktedonobacterales bacterium]|jgi:uncharacterized membrane protein YqgA involved in biofilm formation|nr:MAG: hypothetical protein OJF49_003100 [Ktedonobacterales bacterium]